MSDVELWRSKQVEHGRRIAALLATDAQAFFHREVKDRFIAAPEFADALEDAAVARLKRETAATAEAAAAALREALGDGTWSTVEAPADLDAPITAHPPVAAALGQLEAHLARFLEGHGIPGDPPLYTLPARFIDGENLVPLTRNLWKAARHLAAARGEVRETGRQQAADRRRQRWEEA